VLPVRYEAIRANNVEHMLGRPAPPRAEAIEEGVRLGGQPGQDRGQCNAVGILRDHLNRVLRRFYQPVNSTLVGSALPLERL
jgi:hypothetical protein